MSDTRTTKKIIGAAVATVLFATVAVGSGAGAQSAEPGTINVMALSSGASGELTVSWEAPSAQPTDFRVDWAKTGEQYRSWTVDENHAYPLGDQTEVTLRGLEPGGEYKVRMRARYHSGDDYRRPWSGPWAENDEPIRITDTGTGTDTDTDTGTGTGTGTGTDTDADTDTDTDDDGSDTEARTDDTDDDTDTEAGTDTDTDTDADTDDDDVMGSDSSLGSLAFSEGVLVPSFHATVAVYRVGPLGSDIASVTVAAAATDGDATVAISPADADAGTAGHQVALSRGSNTIEVTVASEDASSASTYTVHVFRSVGAELTFVPPDGCQMVELDDQLTWNWSSYRHRTYEYEVQALERKGIDTDGLSAATAHRTQWRSWGNDCASLFRAEVESLRRQAGRADFWRRPGTHRARYHRMVVHEAGPVWLKANSTSTKILAVRSADGTVVASAWPTEYRAPEFTQAALRVELDPGIYVVEQAQFYSWRVRPDSDQHSLYFAGAGLDLGHTDFAEVEVDYLLSDLEVSDADLDAFSPRQFDYLRRVGDDVTQVTVAPTAARVDMTVSVSPADADADTPGHQVDLLAGGLTAVTVVAELDPTQDGDESVYTVWLSQRDDLVSPLPPAALACARP